MISKARLLKLIILIKHKSHVWYHHHFNPIVKTQLKNPKDIPIIIISFNQLKYLKQLVNFLLKHEYSNIVILDNKSTYKPLLDYFESIENLVKIHRLQKNMGHLSFWENDAVFKKYSKGYYAITDADIVPVEDCPNQFLAEFRKLLDQAYDRTKVGFSLKIDDILDANPNKEKIIQWESQYWKSMIKNNVFKAEVDTTFALYRPNYRYQLKHFTKGWRTDYPMQARHGGWYIDINNLTEEQRYYIKTANASASWQINQSGKLINEEYKKIYKDQ